MHDLLNTKYYLFSFLRSRKGLPFLHIAWTETDNDINIYISLYLYIII